MKTRIVPTSLEFMEIKENIYLSENLASPDRDDYICGCTDACDENCLNFLMQIECCKKCPTKKRCRNRRFQKRKYKKLKIYDAGKKGKGILANEDIEVHCFVIEYVGDVLTNYDYQERVEYYESQGLRHRYAMSLPDGDMIDATVRGNLSRYVNHSCDPNCSVQKWMVNGRTRIGIFALKTIRKGDELTFDYKFDFNRWSMQNCFCGSSNCRGVIATVRKNDTRPTAAGPVVTASTQEIVFNPLDAEDENRLAELVAAGSLLRYRDVVMCASIMRRAELFEHRMQLAAVVMNSSDSSRRDFISCNACLILKKWASQADKYDNVVQYVDTMLRLLGALQFPHKTMLQKSQLMEEVQKWSVVASLEKVIRTGKSHSESSNTQVSMADVTSLAERAKAVVDSWLPLREDIRIPKRSDGENGSGRRRSRSHRRSSSCSSEEKRHRRRHRAKSRSHDRSHGRSRSRRRRRGSSYRVLRSHSRSRSSSGSDCAHRANRPRPRPAQLPPCDVEDAVYGRAQKGIEDELRPLPAECAVNEQNLNGCTAIPHAAIPAAAVASAVPCAVAGDHAVNSLATMFDPRLGVGAAVLPPPYGQTSVSQLAFAHQPLAQPDWLQIAQWYHQMATTPSLDERLLDTNSFPALLKWIIRSADDTSAHSTEGASVDAPHSSDSRSTSDKLSKEAAEADNEQDDEEATSGGDDDDNYRRFRKIVADLVVTKLQQHIASTPVSRVMDRNEFKRLARAFSEAIEAKELKLLGDSGRRLKADRAMLIRATQYLDSKMKSSYEHFLQCIDSQPSGS